MKADLRISVKDYRRGKSLKVLLAEVPFAPARQFWVTMNGERWPASGRPVSLTRVLEARKQVIAQYGSDSDQVQAVGLKKKSEYRQPAPRKKPAA
jgi:hypothetical protein